MKLEYVTSYKYLGIILPSNGLFKLAISTLAKQASKALFSLIQAASKLAFPDPSLLYYLFDSLVKPVLEYGNEVWEYSRRIGNCTRTILQVHPWSTKNSH